jgi:hypothetical protein
MIAPKIKQSASSWGASKRSLRRKRHSPTARLDAAEIAVGEAPPARGTSRCEER